MFLRRFLPLASVAFGIRGLRSFWIGFWLLTKEGRLSGLLDSVAFGFWLVLFDCAILFIIYLSLSYSNLVLFYLVLSYPSIHLSDLVFYLNLSYIISFIYLSIIYLFIYLSIYLSLHLNQI